MRHVSVMLKPASSLCNLRCRYCFYADVSQNREIASYGRMGRETAAGIIRQVMRSLEDGDWVSFSFQGGEPTLAGLDFFQFFVRLAEKTRGTVRVDYALQTNGTLLDEAWCRFLREHRFLVGLSLDVSPQYHDKARVDSQGRGTWGRVLAAKNLLDRQRVEYNVLAVLTQEMARHPQQVWNALRKENLRFVQFVPCLEELNGEDPGPYALTPRRFASFYNGLFPLWLSEFRRGNYISVKFFDDVVNLLARGQVSACGLTGQCHAQLVVEADGGVYPCDFYVLDRFRMGDLGRQTIEEILQSPEKDLFCQEKEPLGEACGQCPFWKLCGGGCKRMRRAEYLERDGAYCGYRDFLERNRAGLEEVIQRVSMK